MATKAEILAILRRGLTGVSEEDLETLAGQLASSGTRGTSAAAATEAELKARKEYLQSVGEMNRAREEEQAFLCLLYTSPSPRDKRQSRMPSSA